jgi:uncharacterized protein YcsI (UPF0317 family)
MNLLMKQNYSAFPEEPFLLRSRIRMGSYDGHTAGMAPGYAQGNVVILPADQAEDFERFCALNPKPCPVLGRSQPGEYWLHTLGEEIDIRTDVPRYRLWVRGVLAAETTDIREVWREDLVTFVLGCSFSFEQALIEAGIPLRHVQQGRNVAMYKTSIDLVPAGPFRGKMVVSMRPLSPENARRASAITARMPRVHGAPIHIGDAAALGIEDLCRPDFGDPIAILPDEVPVFWACGVSPQAAIMEAKPEFCITHAPGCMLITDIRNRTLMSR